MGGFITGSLTGPEVDVTCHHALERKTWTSCSPGINNEGAGRVVMWENLVSWRERDASGECLWGMRIPSNSSPHFMFSLQRSFSRFLWKGLAHISRNSTERRPRRVLKAAALFYLEPNKITAGKTETEIPHCLLSFSIIPPFEIIMVCLWTPAKQVPCSLSKITRPNTLIFLSVYCYTYEESCHF